MKKKSFLMFLVTQVWVSSVNITIFVVQIQKSKEFIGHHHNHHLTIALCLKFPPLWADILRVHPLQTLLTNLDEWFWKFLLWLQVCFLLFFCLLCFVFHFFQIRIKILWMSWVNQPVRVDFSNFRTCFSKNELFFN